MPAAQSIDGARIFRDSRVCLAPMAGYTDAPFRLLCSEFGADFTVTEMVSADGIVRGKGKTRELWRRLPGEAPFGIQIFGSDPAVMAEAASAAEAEGPAFIDINAGCPVKKVVRRSAGSALMRDLALLERIARAVVESVRVPVTAKIRSGWSAEERNFIEAGRMLEGCGVAAVTLHARHRAQGFTGSASWEEIALLREALSIPVIASGDVYGAADYERMASATGCALAMIGRGALGRPWIFREIKSRIAGMEEAAGGSGGLGALIDVIERHLALAIAWKGERGAVIEMRKCYGWYFKGLEDAKRYRIALARESGAAGARRILESIRKESTRQWMNRS